MPNDAPLLSLIRERGPLTVAAFMDLALYHPQLGYYARSAQRSGRAGDFFTSVDVGPLFGELLATQVVEMSALLPADRPVGLVEAGAGNGRLSRDILAAVRGRHPDLYARLRLHLVETSASARAVHSATLGAFADRLVTSSASVPDRYQGVLIGNELFDAMPVHQLVMREDGLREVFVAASGDTLITVDGPVSTPRLVQHLRDLEVTLEPDWRCEISLVALDWMTQALSRMTRGFAIVVDYGHEARELYSVTHSTGTLTSYSRHQSAGPETATLSWLSNPGDQDLTAHVDFTSLQRQAIAGGASVLGLMDQMYFLLALAGDRLDALDLKERLALKTLIMPGGLGSTMKVLVLGKGMGAPRLTGTSGLSRLT